MVILKQIIAGITQEFQIYSNFPNRLISFLLPASLPFISPLIPLFCRTLLHPFLSSSFLELVETQGKFAKKDILFGVRVLDLLLLFPPLWASVSEMTHKRQTKIDRFIHVRCQIHMRPAENNYFW